MSATVQAPSNGQANEQQALSPIRMAAPGLVARMGERYGVDADKMMSTLKATAFRQKQKDGKPTAEVTTEQMMALLVVADQYHLNPWTKEIYAFPQDGGIVPIVSVDGWLRIINERPEFDGLEFHYGPEFELKNDRGEVTGYAQEWVECCIRRKDRQFPIIVREFFRECVRATIPWKDMPRRMLRHKALIQAARVAFGFAGFYDEDDGEVILGSMTASVQSLPDVPSNGRVRHNRLAHVMPPDPQPEKKPEPAADEPAQAKGDEDAELRRQELVDSIWEVLNQERPAAKALDDVGRLIRDRMKDLGADVVAAMQKRYQFHRGNFDAAFAGGRSDRNF